MTTDERLIYLEEAWKQLEKRITDLEKDYSYLVIQVKTIDDSLKTNKNH